jgi:hypothetical protein
MSELFEVKGQLFEALGQLCEAWGSRWRTSQPGRRAAHRWDAGSYQRCRRAPPKRPS